MCGSIISWMLGAADWINSDVSGRYAFARGAVLFIVKVGYCVATVYEYH
jgi:hypothetical protein